MNKRAGSIAALLMLIAPVALAVPPRVVKTTPENGAADVDPATKRIVIVFDQPMSHGGMSIVGGGENFPKTPAKPAWLDDRTLAMPVQLEPEHDYRLSINNQTFTNFRNPAGEPAVPKPIAFRTAASTTAPKLTPQQNLQAISELRKAIDDDYSLRDFRKVDWDRVFADNSPALEKAVTTREFARLAGKMLGAAKDVHVTTRVEQTTFGSYQSGARRNLDLNLLAKTVPHWADTGNVCTGRFDDGIEYVMIRSWSTDQAETLERAYVTITDANETRAKGIIIDVRSNGGGDDRLAEQFAGCFIATTRPFAKVLIRGNGQWSGPNEKALAPNRARPAFRGPLVVLQGQGCMSSTEEFLMMMQAAGATLIGEKSYGAVGCPRPHELSNGVTVNFPIWNLMHLDGSLIEGDGIAPTIEVKTQPSDFTDHDPILEAALKRLRAKN